MRRRGRTAGSSTYSAEVIAARAEVGSSFKNLEVVSSSRSEAKNLRRALLACKRARMAAASPDQRRCEDHKGQGDARPPWRKILWEQQPYPDNYVDQTFLASVLTYTETRRSTIAGGPGRPGSMIMVPVGHVEGLVRHCDSPATRDFVPLTISDNINTNRSTV